LVDHVTVSDVRSVEIEDLLGRDTIDLKSWFAATEDIYGNKRILVTGAGGSIGRELCRQLITLNPASILLLDKDENAVFEAEMELREVAAGRSIELQPIIGDLRTERRLEKIFEKFAPHVVFHAAAHKHVPLMEQNPSEAVLNNIVGTATLLEMCARHHTLKCVMVSTDKAVNPTSVMGATKRVSELMFQAQAARDSGGCQYSCVRFGNVLGSRGSVVPHFREQIKRGGPVTVTHPDMVRYFMTIPEAAQLIIQAGALGTKGEIFLLDMGEPVRVVDLARDMIQLSGLRLGEDIEIKFTGLRPGEKMKEELLIAEEGASSTQYEKIFVAPPLRYDFAQLGFWVRRLGNAANEGDDAAVYEIFADMNIGFCSDFNERGKHVTVAG
jgi:FlaA1/EpsC-like NDP-sugar epimerase